MGMTRTWILAALASAVPLPAAASAQNAHSAVQAERLLIDKSDRTLTIIFGDGTLQTMHGLRFGDAWDQGPKRQQGDERTPEGEYRVLEHRTSRIDYPHVVFLPALYLDYPNLDDVSRAEALGVHPGGAIMIHGPHPDFTRAELREDWTDGCVALGEAQMHYLMRYTQAGTPVSIQP
jgi:murein L,D-transpeptidase YafK